MTKKRTYSAKIIIVFDVIVICLALISSWLIRSQFNLFYYNIPIFSILFPWVLFSRILSQYLFGFYSLSISHLNNHDIFRVFKYNLLPSLVLVILRFISGREQLQMPLSMIAMEYLFTTSGSLFVRLLFYNFTIKKTIPEGYKRKAILWAEVKDFREQLNLYQLRDKYNIDIKGIINDNPLFWNSSVSGIRVYGNESELPVISASDENISTVLFLNDTILNKRTKRNLMTYISSLRMEVGIISNEKFEIKSNDWIMTI